MDNYQEINRLFEEYRSIPSDMKSYGSKELMDLKEEFEPHSDLVAGMVLPMLKSPPQPPYLKFQHQLKPSFASIEKLLANFQPSTDEQKEQEAILLKKNALLKQIAEMVSGEKL